MVEQFCILVLHVTVNCNAEAFVWFIGAKDTEIKHSKTAKIPFMGIVDILNKLTPYGLFKLTPIDNL